MPFLGTTGGGSVKQYGGLANLGYFIKNSLRFRRANSAYLNRTFGTPTSNILWTWSCWFKRGQLGSGQRFFGRGTDASGVNQTAFTLNSDDTINFFIGDGAGSTLAYLATSQVFRDPASWYHIVFVYDSANGTANNRMRMYLNGTEITAFSSRTNPSSSQSSQWNVNSVEHRIGVLPTSPSSYFDGYMAEINFIDGQALTPSSFGKTDNGTGQWIPKKYLSTYGNNGFYLKFADASAATAAAIGKDSSPNGNNWTPSGISVTAGVTYDAMIDSPTLSAVASNYATLNPVAKGPQFTVTDGNLRTGNATVGNYHQTIGSTIAVNTGKWYWEIASNGTVYNSRSLGIALVGDLTTAGDNPMWNDSTQLKNYRAIQLASSTTVQPCRSIAGTVTTSTNITLPVTLTGSNTFMVAIDISAGAIWFGVDGTWLKSATTEEIIAGTTTNAVYTDIGSPSDSWTPALYNYLGSATGYGWIANFGQRPFQYSAPSGFKSLNTYNLP
jgi:hypothetical protein